MSQKDDDDAMIIVQEQRSGQEDEEEKQKLLSNSGKESSLWTTASAQALAEAQRQDILGTTLNLVVITIGVEIVAIPFAVQRMGVWLGFAVFIMVAFLSHISNMMYIKVKDMAGGRYESIYELAFALYGRTAIFFVCIVQFMLNFASLVLYFIVVGDLFESMTRAMFISMDASKSEADRNQQLSQQSGWVQIFSHRAFWILMMGLALVSVIF